MTKFPIRVRELGVFNRNYESIDAVVDDEHVHVVIHGDGMRLNAETRRDLFVFKTSAVRDDVTFEFKGLYYDDIKVLLDESVTGINCIGASQLDEVANCGKSLRYLNVYKSTVNDITMLPKCYNLERLIFRTNDVLSDILPVCLMPSLQYVKLHDVNCIEELPVMTCRHLVLSDFAFDPDLSCLQYFPFLRKLELINVSNVRSPDQINVNVDELLVVTDDTCPLSTPTINKARDMYYSTPTYSIHIHKK